MSVRESFVARFGEGQAQAFERAADAHRRENGGSRGPGSDPFKTVIAITIGWDCFSNPAYREHHGITAPVDELTDWIRKDCDLGNHDGDFDALALFAGCYDDFINRPTEAA